MEQAIGSSASIPLPVPARAEQIVAGLIADGVPRRMAENVIETLVSVMAERRARSRLN